MSLKQLFGESDNEYQERLNFYNFIIKKKVNNGEKISKIYTNIKYRNCIYSSKMYNFIKKLEKEYMLI